MKNEISITLSIQADSPDKLSALTIDTQLRWQMSLQFKDFTQLKNGKFICWYSIPIKTYSEKIANGL